MISSGPEQRKLKAGMPTDRASTSVCPKVSYDARGDEYVRGGIEARQLCTVTDAPEGDVGKSEAVKVTRTADAPYEQECRVLGDLRMAKLELLSDLHQEVWPLDFIIEAGSDDGDVVARSLADEGVGVSQLLSRERRG